MNDMIRVTILDDHQSIVDGYHYRLGKSPGIEVVATLAYGEELEASLRRVATDVLLLDVNVPTSAENPNPYPILHLIPRLLDEYTGLYILVISMYAERGLIRAVMEAGASGYLLKDDQASIRNLAGVVATVAGGAIHFSQKAHQLYAGQFAGEGSPALTARQLEALSLCAAYPEKTTGEIASMMAIRHSTVRNLLSTSYVKLKVHNRIGAISKARTLGLLASDPLPPAGA